MKAGQSTNNSFNIFNIFQNTCLQCPGYGTQEPGSVTINFEGEGNKIQKHSLRKTVNHKKKDFPLSSKQLHEEITTKDLETRHSVQPHSLNSQKNTCLPDMQEKFRMSAPIHEASLQGRRKVSVNIKNQKIHGAVPQKGVQIRDLRQQCKKPQGSLEKKSIPLASQENKCYSSISRVTFSNHHTPHLEQSIKAYTTGQATNKQNTSTIYSVDEQWGHQGGIGPGNHSPTFQKAKLPSLNQMNIRKTTSIRQPEVQEQQYSEVLVGLRNLNREVIEEEEEDCLPNF